MTAFIPRVVIGLKTLTLVIGGAITYFAAKAAYSTDGRGLAALAVGFGVVTLGTLSAGVADQALGLARSDALILENALTTLGFAIVLFSLVRIRDVR